MACPNCDGTMQSLGKIDERPVWLCPRCGTVKLHDPFGSESPTIYTPNLVDRCREFERNAPSMFGDAWTGSGWKRLGIAEAINPPESRPQ